MKQAIFKNGSAGKHLSVSNKLIIEFPHTPNPISNSHIIYELTLIAILIYFFNNHLSSYTWAIYGKRTEPIEALIFDTINCGNLSPLL